jgi:hypothetical protein
MCIVLMRLTGKTSFPRLDYKTTQKQLNYDLT